MPDVMTSSALRRASCGDSPRDYCALVARADLDMIDITTIPLRFLSVKHGVGMFVDTGLHERVIMGCG